MTETLQFVVQYGYALLFGWVLIEQGGLPVLATPLLLAAGALAGQHRMSLPLVVLAGTAGCLGADIFWYHFGQRRGAIVLNLLCRISMEPDSCVRRTETTFSKYGARTLLICKFVPGLNTAAPALAGMVSVPYHAPALRCAGRVAVDHRLRDPGLYLQQATGSRRRRRSHAGRRLPDPVRHRRGGLRVVSLARTRAVYREVKGDRITPDELKHQLESGEHVEIIDLRHPLDVLTDPRTLPGAVQISPEDLQKRSNEITHDGEIVLF